jgi:uncharacterized protein YdiU (UPF0061 family)
MLEALGVYTSKALSLFETGEQLYRGDEPSPARSSVLVRLNHSFIRIGTFQRLAWLDDRAGLERLVDFTIANYVPVEPSEGSVRVAALYAEVCRRLARLVAGWHAAGFVHGVLNTDNMNVTGESFDYGPWRFLPVYDPGFVAAYFDHGGLYAFGRQPAAVKWSLACFAETLTALVPPAELRPAYDGFDEAVRVAGAEALVARLGLRPRGPRDDVALAGALEQLLAEEPVGYERFFFDWWGGAASEGRALAGPAAAFYAGEAFACFRERLERYEAADPARLLRPYFQHDAPVTLLIEEVTGILEAACLHDDWSGFESKIAAIREMGEACGFDGLPGAAAGGTRPAVNSGAPAASNPRAPDPVGS